ncbi:MAG: C4-dicarboxylate ABC transporter substrate-binding protein, partial [Synergistales bacterium]|nr:C4-dicarboxylate ABC transporter substrate-binding protein [Synergistales bacterium]
MKTGKMKGILLILAAALVFSSVPAMAVTHVTIGTASVGGMNYPLGIAMATIWNGNVKDVKAVAIATGGSVNNIDMLR